MMSCFSHLLVGRFYPFSLKIVEYQREQTKLLAPLRKKKKKINRRKHEKKCSNTKVFVAFFPLSFCSHERTNGGRKEKLVVGIGFHLKKEED